MGTDVFYDELKNIVYVTTNDYSIRAIDNSTGKILWTQDRHSLSATYETGILYSVEDLGDKDVIRFSAFDVETQKELWQQDVSPLKSVLKLTIIDNLLIASGSKGLIALDKSTGDLVWRTNVGETFYSRPVKFNDVLYAKGPSRKIYAISPTDGNVIGYVKLENANSIIENTNEIRAGVYKLDDGIVFNTRNAVYIYKLK